MNGEQQPQRRRPAQSADAAPSDPAQNTAQHRPPMFLPPPPPPPTAVQRLLPPPMWPLDFSPQNIYHQLQAQQRSPSSLAHPVFLPTASSATGSQSLPAAPIAHHPLHPFLTSTLPNSQLLHSYQQLLMAAQQQHNSQSPTNLHSPASGVLHLPSVSSSPAFPFDHPGLSRYPSMLLHTSSPSSSTGQPPAHTPLGPPTAPAPHRQPPPLSTASSAMPPPLQRPLHRLISPTALTPSRRPMPTTPPSTSTATHNNFELTSPGTLPVQPYYPTHFMRGTVIQLATGDLKRVEEMNTEDFVHSAHLTDDLRIDSSTVMRIDDVSARDSSNVLLCFAVGERRVQVSVEASVEHPFFVVGQGWSSCNPDRTRNLYGLPCQRLQVGDVCISLTNRSCLPMAPTLASTSSSSSSSHPSTSSVSTVESPRDRLLAALGLPSSSASLNKARHGALTRTRDDERIRRSGRASVPPASRNHGSSPGRGRASKRKRADSVS